MKMLMIREVTKMTSLSRVTIWRKVQEGVFPKPIQLSHSRVGFVEAEIEEWLLNRPRGVCPTTRVRRQGPKREAPEPVEYTTTEDLQKLGLL